MNLFPFLGLLFFTIFCFSAADVPTTSEILEHGQNIMERLKNLSNVGLDLYGELKVITLTTADALKLIHPAATLGVAFAKALIRPDSVEAQMLKNLDEKITRNFIDLSHQTHYEINSAITHAQATEYRLQIKVYLEDIQTHLKFLLNPITGRVSKEAVGEFKRKCTAELTSPWNLLKKIESFTMCKRSPEESIELYLNFKNLINKMSGNTLNDQLILDENYGFGNQYRRIQELWNATKVISQIRNEVQENKMTFRSIAQIDNFLNEKIKENSQTLQSDFRGCIIDDFFAKNHWKTSIAVNLAVFLERDIRLAFIVGSFCVGMAFQEDEMRKEKEAELGKLYVRIANSASNRTLQLMNATWSSIDLRETEKIMKDLSYSDISAKILEDNATQIWHSVNSIGPQGYSKQVVVTAFGPEASSYSLNCDVKYCISYNSTKNQKGKAGLSAVVVRTPYPKHFIRATAEWAERNREKIGNLLNVYSSVPFNADVTGSIQHDVGQFITTNHGHGFLLVRDWAWFATNCINNYAGVKCDQLEPHSNETPNQWRNGVTTIVNYTSGIGGVCASLYIFA